MFKKKYQNLQQTKYQTQKISRNQKSIQKFCKKNLKKFQKSGI